MVIVFVTIFLIRLKRLESDLFCHAIPWTELIWRSRNLNNDLSLDIQNCWSTWFKLFLCKFNISFIYKYKSQKITTRVQTQI